MRLLRYNSGGDFHLDEFYGSNIPEYAILSHRWGAEEVTNKDVKEGTGKSKTGYTKIHFCGQQAKRDGLQYFWVDTCCIDKSDSVEVHEAINSMFRWYQRASKCYVYLSDVSRPRSDSVDGFNEPWESSFWKSEWFTRGWTLQELIAPSSVDFFSKEGDLLGDKKSLEGQIHMRTEIPISALRGAPLSEFSVKERFSWAAKRVTTKDEDQAYSLFGLFSVFLPIIYGEGREYAFQRLQEEVDKRVKGASIVPNPEPTSRGNVTQENTNRLEIQPRATSFRYSVTYGGRSKIRCYRCDNGHLLYACYATLDTVSKARDRRMNSNRCVNCGSEEHWVKDCDWEDLWELKEA
ncbi:heterokaryon incompatibility protein-domain-containing protein [Xylogone sp. PMI_703]|nr:heterokaryon incompatibility protein-domain-containing protein [Xylogone sp. PMI_703]